jgi:uncharacterized protein YozE (UPF0346 family)
MKNLAPKDNNEESPSAAHLSEAFTKRRISKHDCFQLYNQPDKAYSDHAFAKQTDNFQQILLSQTHISRERSQNLVQETSAPMIAALASR